LLSLQE